MSGGRRFLRLWGHIDPLQPDFRPMQGWSTPGTLGAQMFAKLIASACVGCCACGWSRSYDVLFIVFLPLRSLFAVPLAPSMGISHFIHVLDGNVEFARQFPSLLLGRIPPACPFTRVCNKNQRRRSHVGRRLNKSLNADARLYEAREMIAGIGPRVRCTLLALGTLRWGAQLAFLPKPHM